MSTGRNNCSMKSARTPGCFSFFSFCFFIAFVVFAFGVSRNSDPGSHTYADSSSPLSTTVRALRFCHKISALSSLDDSRRIVLTHARRCEYSTLFFCFCVLDVDGAKEKLRDFSSGLGALSSAKRFVFMVTCNE